MLKIDIFYNNISPDRALEVFVNEKIGGLGRLIKGSTVEAKVEIGKPSKHHRSGPVFYAEVNLKIGGALLRATATNKDLRTAIIEVKNELQTQVKKFKEKRTNTKLRSY